MMYTWPMTPPGPRRSSPARTMGAILVHRLSTLPGQPDSRLPGAMLYAIADSFTRSTMPVAVSHNAGGAWKITDISGRFWRRAVDIREWNERYSCLGNQGFDQHRGPCDQYQLRGRLLPVPSHFHRRLLDAWAPMTGISGNTEYVAYRTNPGSANSQEYAAVSLNAGKTWSARWSIGSPGATIHWPVTVPTDGSTAFIAWYMTTGHQCVRSLGSSWRSRRLPAGRGWSAPVVLGGSLGESDVATQAISSNGGVLFAVWVNTVSGNQSGLLLDRVLRPFPYLFLKTLLRCPVDFR